MAVTFQHVRIFALAAVFATSAPASERCPDADVILDDVPTALASRICDAVSRATERLADCGLAPSDAVVVEVIQGSSHPLVGCLGLFDCVADRITLSDPASYGELVSEGSPFSDLPPLDVFSGVVVHEYTHSVIFQKQTDRQVSLVDQEYIAYAMQLSFYPEDIREAVLDHYSTGRRTDPDGINLMIHDMAPLLFAARAYSHFALPENGCNTVRDLMAGRASFYVLQP